MSASRARTAAAAILGRCNSNAVNRVVQRRDDDKVVM